MNLAKIVFSYKQIYNQYLFLIMNFNILMTQK
jgi:hypothetical protein